MTPVRAWLLWTASFVAFPLGGIAGRHADSFLTALGAAAVGYGTTLAELAVMGAITGAITVSALLGLLLHRISPLGVVS